MYRILSCGSLFPRRAFKHNMADGRDILFTFGLIADVQYANQDDGTNYDKTIVRRYRHSLEVLRIAVDSWTKEKKIQIVVQLGDLLDGRCTTHNKDRNHCLSTIIKELDKLDSIPRCDIIGNHELYNFSRVELNDPSGPLKTSQFDEEILMRHSPYYSLAVRPGFRFIIIDSFDVCCMNGCGEKTTQAAYDYLKTRNPNDITKDGVDWLAGLTGADLRFAPYNGMVSKEQLIWLSQTLRLAANKNEKCIIFSHVALTNGACDESCVVWNNEEVMAVLHNPYKAVKDLLNLPELEPFPTPVVACFYGHAHLGGFMTDDHNIHHITLQSPLEVSNDEVAFASCDITPSKLIIRGQGKVPSRTLSF